MASGAKDKSRQLADVTYKTSAGDVAMANEQGVVVIKTVGAATAVTLPPTPSTNRLVFVKDGLGDAATNNITISPAAGTIDGAASYVISENFGAVAFLYNGTEWNVLNQTNAVSAAELGFLNGVTAGTATASKAVVLDSSKGIATITSATITTAIISGQRHADVATLAAAGTAQGNAAAIANRVTIVTGADGAAGVILPAGTIGDEYHIYSSAAGGLLVYPAAAGGGTINDGSANAAIEIEGKSAATFIKTSTLNWAAIYTPNA